jgi:cytochrome c oxidase assembly protein subunit 15
LASLTAPISQGTFRRLCLAALVALFTIVITGALVRLTGSGLGCSDWPACNDEKFVDVSTGHGAIEQINRLFTGVVAASVIAAVLGSLRLAKRRRGITWLSVGLVAGVLAQVVIGGIVVLTGLNPWANMAHFLVSMVLLANALVLYRAASWESGELRSVKIPARSFVLGGAATVAIVTGTVVTATGPHAGDEDAIRFGFDIGSVARVHGASVMVTIALVAWILWKARTRVERREQLEHKIATLLGVALLQALVGYVQYFSGVPAMLVAIHIAGASLVWLSVIDVMITDSVTLRRVDEQSRSTPSLSR